MNQSLSPSCRERHGLERSIIHPDLQELRPLDRQRRRFTCTLRRASPDEKWGIQDCANSGAALFMLTDRMPPGNEIARVYMVNGQTSRKSILEELRRQSLEIEVAIERVHEEKNFKKETEKEKSVEDLEASLFRCAVGQSELPLRSYMNHEDFGQCYWDKGHPMNHMDFQHDFGFWAFGTGKQPGTKQVLVGIAGGHATLGPSRCLLRAINTLDAREVAVDMTQIAVVPAFSFWAYDAPHRGTVRIAVLEADGNIPHCLLVRLPHSSPDEEDGDGLAPVPTPVGFSHVFDFWAYPDPGPPGPLQLCEAARFSQHVGFISSGGDIYCGWFTLAEAQAWALALPGCQGFTYSEDPMEDGKFFVFFKNHWDVSGTGWSSQKLHRSGEFNPEEVVLPTLCPERCDGGPMEYAQARSSLCLRRDILSQCEINRKAEVLSQNFSGCNMDLDSLLLAVGRKAFPQEALKACLEGGDISIELLHDEASPKVGLVAQLSKLTKAESLLQEWRSALLIPLLRYIAEAAEPGDAAASVLLLGYCSWRLFDGVICPAIARRSFDKCLRFVRVDIPALDATIDVPACSVRKEFRQWVYDYLEVHKEKALASAFLEPCKLYWRRIGGPLGMHEAHVDTHAANAFAGLVQHTLGVACPMPVSWDDVFAVYGVVEFLQAGFLKGSLRATQRLENFGQSFSKLSRERGEEDGLLEPVAMGGVQFIFPGARSPAAMVEQAFWMAEEGQPLRETLAPYLDRFAGFFHKVFFLEAACSAAVADELGGGAHKLANVLRVLCAEDGTFASGKITGDELPRDDHELCRMLLWDFDEYFFPCFDEKAATKAFDFVGGVLREG